MYINVWCLLLAFPRLEINLDPSIACLFYSNLRVVLVDYSITRSRSLVPVCVRGTLEKTGTQGFAPYSYLFVLSVRGT